MCKYKWNKFFSQIEVALIFKIIWKKAEFDSLVRHGLKKSQKGRNIHFEKLCSEKKIPKNIFFRDKLFWPISTDMSMYIYTYIFNLN